MAVLLAIYFIMMPFDVFRISGTGTILRYYALFIVGATFLTTVNNVRNVRIPMNGFTLNMFAFLVMCLVSILYSINTSASVAAFTTLALNFALVFCCNFYNYSYNDIKLLEKALLIGGIFTIILSFRFADFSERGRMTLSILDDTADQNYINGYLLFALGFAIHRWLFLKTKILNKILMIFICFAVLLFTMYTGSRGALIAELFMFIAAVMINFIITKKDTRYFILLFIVVLVLILSFNYILSLLPEEIAIRYSTDYIGENNTTGRLDIWSTLLTRFFNDTSFSILFGKGIGTSSDYNTLNGLVAHNAFIDMLIGTGFVGVIFYIGMFVSSIKRAWKTQNYMILLTLLGYIVMMMSLSLVAFKPIFNALLMINIVEKYLSKGEVRNAN